MSCNVGIIFLSIARQIEVFSHRFVITIGFFIAHVSCFGILFRIPAMKADLYIVFGHENEFMTRLNHQVTKTVA